MWGGEYFTIKYGLQQHNILFQMYDLYGVVPFVLLVILIINAIISVLYVVKNTFVCNPEKRYIILMFLSLMLYYFEDPALTSNYIITSILFAFLGYLHAIRNSYE